MTVSFCVDVEQTAPEKGEVWISHHAGVIFCWAGQDRGYLQGKESWGQSNRTRYSCVQIRFPCCYIRGKRDGGLVCEGLFNQTKGLGVSMD